VVTFVMYIHYYISLKETVKSVLVGSSKVHPHSNCADFCSTYHWGSPIIKHQQTSAKFEIKF